ncbi:MAG: dihydrolipoyl dehydrogenase [Parahaliea sp.]
MTHYDLLVVGAGPGGYVAAIRGAQLGLKTAVIEKQHLGGICLNWGCIPTKALLKGAQVAHTIAGASRYGFNVGDVSFDIAQLVRHSRAVSEQLAAGVDYLLKKHAVDIIRGTARMTGKCQLAVTQGNDSSAYSADHIILATGARPRVLPGVVPDGEQIWSCADAMVPDTLPESLLVIGSGAIGVEFASLYSDLGSKVILVEALDAVLPAEDSDICAYAHKQFENRGIEIHVATQVESVSKTEDSISCRLIDKQGNIEERTVDKVLVSVGVQGNIEDLGLEELGAKIEHSFICTDQWSRTNVVGLYAIGDVAGPPCLAHKASHEAVICVEKLAGVAGVRPLAEQNIPRCTYGRPQVASIGRTERALKAQGIAYKTGQFSFSANGKALAIAEDAGFVKVLFDSNSGELLGAHMIGSEVTEQIQGFSLVQALEGTEEEILHAIIAHPTLTEAMHEAILDACGKAIHH